MELLKKPIIRDVITNITYLLLVIIYFICFNTQVITLQSKIITNYINISSIVFLSIAIIMFELGYRKEKTKIFINGIEFLVLAISTLFLKHIPKVLGITMQNYTEMVVYGFTAYYILKLATTYTKMKQEQLNKLSDIKDIVKEEIIKKPTKRKNKKEEGK